MFAITVTYDIKHGQEEAAAEHFRALMHESRKEPGNHMYHVFRSTENPGRFFLFEQYENEAAFLAHKESPHFIRDIKKGIWEMMEERRAEHVQPLQ